MTAVLVIAMETEDAGEAFQVMVETVRGLFVDRSDVKIWGAIREDAQKVLAVFDEGVR